MGTSGEYLPQHIVITWFTTRIRIPGSRWSGIMETLQDWGIIVPRCVRVKLKDLVRDTDHQSGGWTRWRREWKVIREDLPEWKKSTETKRTIEYSMATLFKKFPWCINWKGTNQAVCSREVTILRIQSGFANNVIGHIRDRAITSILGAEVSHLPHILVHNTMIIAQLRHACPTLCVKKVWEIRGFRWRDTTKQPYSAIILHWHANHNPS